MHALESRADSKRKTTSTGNLSKTLKVHFLRATLKVNCTRA